MTSDKIFSMLLKSGEYVKGEQIAGLLGITRTAVNKHIKKLQSEGIEIDATRRGYKYIPSNTLTRVTLSSKILECGLPPQVIVEVVDSTNTAVKAIISSGDNEGNDILFVAPMQIRGRGRLTRQFESSEGGVYMTLCYNPKSLSVTDSLKIVLLTGLCVARVLSEHVADVTIKWPNDVFIKDKKICGILLESVLNEYMVDKIILGIGVNVSNNIPDNLSSIVTSLAENGVSVNREDIIIKITKLLYKELAEYEISGFKSFLDEYISKSRTIGNIVTVKSGERNITGQAVGLSEEGYLLVNNCGVIEKVIVGDVEV